MKRNDKFERYIMNFESGEQNGGEHRATDSSEVNQQPLEQSFNEITLAGETAGEITLTDHLNKRLLNSFLQRLNQLQPNASTTDDANDTAEWQDLGDSSCKENASSS
jgi:hypothetical protein